MSALAPSLINSLLGNGAPQGHLVTPVTEKTSASSKIVRKHYYDGGQYHYDGYGHHEHSYHGGSGGGGGKKSKSIALSALTLLAFLFFLHLLQQCLQEQMEAINPQVVIMQARIKAAREAEAKLQKEAEKRVGNTPEVVTDKTSMPRDTKQPNAFDKSQQAQDLYQYEQARFPVKLKYYEAPEGK